MKALLLIRCLYFIICLAFSLRVAETAVSRSKEDIKSSSSSPTNYAGARYKVGSRVSANWGEVGLGWYDGTVTKVHAVNGGKTFLYDVKYDDEYVEEHVEIQYLKPSTSSWTDRSVREDLKKMKVIDLTAKNFSSTIGVYGNRDVWLIEFWAPWCGHCMQFADTYSDIAKYFHVPGGSGVKVAKVNSQVEKALTSRFGVRAYPSFYLVQGWTVYEFDGQRSEENLKKFAKGGFEEGTPIPFYESPLGPMGQLKGLFTYSGIVVADAFFSFQESFGLSVTMAGILMFMAVFVCWFLILIALVAISLAPRAKQD